ncbi:MAG: NFACT family protein [Hominimerdicola sp.]
MALDGIYLSLIRKELLPLIDGRVDKIHQPSREEISMSIRTREGLKKIIFNTGAGTARVHITEAEIENPKTPPMFCMFLRKHLSSGKLCDIRQDGFERILYFDFDASNEMGDIVRLTLAMEIMGRRSNLILINSDGKIVDSIKRVGQDMSSVRMVLPGMTYTLPPKEERLNFFECSKEDFSDKLNEFKALGLSKALMKVFEGISPVFAREAEFFTFHGREKAVEDMSEDDLDRLWFYVKKIREEISENKNIYTVMRTKEGNLKDFCFCDIHQYGALMITKDFQSPSQLLDYFYSQRDVLSRVKQKAQDLFKLLLNTTERTSRRIENQRQELKECAEREKFKIYGDLIMSNLYCLEKGQGVAEIQNYYEEGCPTVKILLDKRLTPTQNAQKYYKEYRKLDTAEKKLKELIKEGEEEEKYLDSVFDSLTRAVTEGDIAELRTELAEQGYAKFGKQKGKPPKALPPMKFKSSDGYDIRVGRNNKQNDRLTCKESEKTDLWLHTKDITGSHVIVSCGGDFPPDRTIEEAAIIAAYFSKGRNSSRVQVDYTHIKNVKKPNGSKPGMVIFINNYTITVKPDEDLVEKLRVK